MGVVTILMVLIGERMHQDRNVNLQIAQRRPPGGKVVYLPIDNQAHTRRTRKKNNVLSA